MNADNKKSVNKNMTNYSSAIIVGARFVVVAIIIFHNFFSFSTRSRQNEKYSFL
jgi:hypothetical protein